MVKVLRVDCTIIDDIFVELMKVVDDYKVGAGGAADIVRQLVKEHKESGLKRTLRFVITHEGEEWIAWPTTPSGVNISSRAALSKDKLKPWCDEIAKELHCEAEFVDGV